MEDSEDREKGWRIVMIGRRDGGYSDSEKDVSVGGW